MEKDAPTTSYVSQSQFVEDRIHQMKKIFKEVRQLQEASVARNAERLNTNRKDASFFKIGDFVLLHRADRNAADCAERDGHTDPKTVPRKFQFTSSGPYQVVGHGDYQTVLIEKFNKRRELVKAKHLSLYIPFEDDISFEELIAQTHPRSPLQISKSPKNLQPRLLFY